ncbi:hypothetical protein G6F42_026963 [Rhizopus arrhizus]|nr:hypothetical protein G6F42_026963 [Rhizopus arrhizus]
MRHELVILNQDALNLDDDQDDEDEEEEDEEEEEEDEDDEEEDDVHYFGAPIKTFPSQTGHPRNTERPSSASTPTPSYNMPTYHSVVQSNATDEELMKTLNIF